MSLLNHCQLRLKHLRAGHCQQLCLVVISQLSFCNGIESKKEEKATLSFYELVDGVENLFVVLLRQNYSSVEIFVFHIYANER
ncbi:hypothetical protein T08_1802 [Trichinella sp. T8]|nr:hypothetical protein T08_1802 [Trichinella sp. T8]